MGKFYGKIGYAETVEEPAGSGIFVEKIIERSYAGDLIRNNRRLQDSGQVNDNINISNNISIVADQFAYQNIYKMRYAVYANTKWKISDVEVNYPRLKLTLGEVYNENSDGSSEIA